MSKYTQRTGLLTLSFVILISGILLRVSTKGQQEGEGLELDAPVPSITIEEESGETTTFGGDLNLDAPSTIEDVSAQEESITDASTQGSTEIEVEKTTETKVEDELPTSIGAMDVKNGEMSENSEIVEATQGTEIQAAESEEVVEKVVPAIEDEEGKKLERLIAADNKKKNESKKASEEKKEKKLPKEPKKEEVAKDEKVTPKQQEIVEVSTEDEPLPSIATSSSNEEIVAAPEAPTPPVTEEVSELQSLEPPTISEATERDQENPDLSDLPIGELPDKGEDGMNREVEIARLIQQLEEEAASKEVAKSSLVPNQMQEEINFDNVPLGAAFRLLAEQAGFNFVEPNLPEGEFLSLRFQKMRPLDAFMKIAQARGFAVVTENGFTTLKRPDLVTPEFLEVRRYRVKYIQPKWIVQSLANLLEINLERPEDTIRSFPEPNQDASSYGGSNNGNSGGGGGTSTSGSTGNTGSQNIGLPTSPRWTSSLPYDEPLFAGEGEEGQTELPFIFIDRTTSAFVVKTTKDKHKMVAQYIASVDRPEPQIMIETKVVEISVSDLLEYGTDWSDALGKGITVNWEGAKVNLADVFSGGGAGTWSAFLTIPEASITIRAFQEMDNGAVMNMPRTMTRSGVPVSISSTITDATPAYQLATGTGGSGAVSTPSGFNTFTTGVTIDVVPQILENGMIDINVNPTVANQVGERTIEANEATGTPKQTIPIISSRALTTSAIVPSGMTIMLGGIVETKNFTNDGGIPVLSKIPFLGKTVFGNTDREDSRKTLIVFVTPKIIYPDQYQKVWTNEQEWRAMIEGNRADMQTTQSSIPEPLEIRKALPVRDTLDQVPARQKKRK